MQRLDTGALAAIRGMAELVAVLRRVGDDRRHLLNRAPGAAIAVREERSDVDRNLYVYSRLVWRCRFGNPEAEGRPWSWSR